MAIRQLSAILLFSIFYFLFFIFYFLFFILYSLFSSLLLIFFCHRRYPHSNVPLSLAANEISAITKNNHHVTIILRYDDNMDGDVNLLNDLLVDISIYFSPVSESLPSYFLFLPLNISSSHSEQ
jgi:hypothetical protein